MSFPYRLTKMYILHVLVFRTHTDTYTHFIGADCQLLNFTLKDGLNEKYWRVRQCAAPVKATLYNQGAKMGSQQLYPIMRPISSSKPFCAFVWFTVSLAHKP